MGGTIMRANDLHAIASDEEITMLCIVLDAYAGDLSDTGAEILDNLRAAAHAVWRGRKWPIEHGHEIEPPHQS